MTARYRVGVDIGGTFTDVVVQDAARGRTTTGKVLSTPEDPARAVVEGLRRFVPDDGTVGFLVHGTTVGLNALLERRGARVGLVTTHGFRDVYTIAGNDRRDIFSLTYRKPEPLVPPDRIYTVRERLAYDGSVVTPPELDDLEPVVAAAHAGEIDAVAVCLLFSFREPAHELAVGAHLEARLPPGVPVALSHRLSPEWREYARTSTTVMNAYVAPVVRRYLATLGDELRPVLGDEPLHVMQSNGGVLTARAARELPIQTLLSGPVGGAAGCQALAAELGRPDLICVDAGGTSFDASLVVGGAASVSPEAELEGLPLQMSVVDIHVIGAGGGSVAWLEAGALRVGPRSAGSVPGPACYGRGGTEPTVTDANLVLGRVDERRFAGGGMRLDAGAAGEALARVGEPLGMTAEELAQGVLDIVNAKMADAIRTITVRRGIDPRGFSLVAYGGAGPAQAVAIAEQLDIADVVVPASPGTFSAWGMLQTDIRTDLRATFVAALDGVEPAEVESAFARLEAEGLAALADEGVSPSARATARSADLRYAGQEYTITVPVPDAPASCGGPDGPDGPDGPGGPSDPGGPGGPHGPGEPDSPGGHGSPGGRFDAAALRQRFDEQYRQTYGHASPKAVAELVTLRVTATGTLAKPPPEPPAPAPRTPWATRSVLFGGQPTETVIVPRDELAVGEKVEGPAIVEESTATTVVPPGWVATVVAGGHLTIVEVTA